MTLKEYYSSHIFICVKLADNKISILWCRALSKCTVTEQVNRKNVSINNAGTPYNTRSS